MLYFKSVDLKGTKNMRDYIEKYYKQNLKYFDKNVCSDGKEKKRSFLGISL